MYKINIQFFFFNSARLAQSVEHQTFRPDIHSDIWGSWVRVPCWALTFFFFSLPKNIIPKNTIFWTSYNIFNFLSNAIRIPFNTVRLGLSRNQQAVALGHQDRWPCPVLFSGCAEPWLLLVEPSDKLPSDVMRTIAAHLSRLHPKQVQPLFLGSSCILSGVFKFPY